MFLKSLQLNGFKAFSKKTLIQFSSGVGALIGPNGCGKSNVIDAIKWVLGEQRPSEFRAQKMEDIIFSGTQSQKSSGMAEVVLTLLNEEGQLPLDFTEIAITRRLYRSGESEYLINNKPCRLRDINDLFLDTLIGPTTIVEQGQIEKILSKNQSEKRQIFEQAASIYKYRDRRQHYEKQLEKTKQNLERLRDLSHQLKRQHQTLSKQSEATDRYLKLQTKLKEKQIDLFLYELVQKKRKKEGFNTSLEEIKGEIEQKNRALGEERIKSKENRENFSRQRERVVEKEKKVIEVRSGVDSLERQNKILLERKEEIKNALRDRKEERKDLHQKQKDFEIKKKAIETELGHQQAEMEANKKNIEKLKEVVADMRHKKEALIREKQQKEQRIKEIKKAVLTIQSQYKSIIEELIKEIDVVKKKADVNQGEQERLRETILDHLHKVKQSLGEMPLSDEREIVPFLEQWENRKNEQKTTFMALLKNWLDIKNLLSNLEKDFVQFSDKKKDLYEYLFSSEGSYAKKEKMDNELVNLNEESISCEKQIENCRKSIEEQDEEMRAKDVALRELSMKNNLLEHKKKTLLSSLNEKNSELNAYASRLGKNAELLVEYEKKLTQIGETLVENQQRIQELQKEKEKIQKELNVFVSAFEKEKITLQKNDELLQKMANQLRGLEDRKNALLTETKLIDRDMQTLVDRATREYNEDIRHYEQLIINKTFDPKELESETLRIKRDLQELGAINPLAKEEFRQMDEQIKMQEKQRDDVLASINDLERIVKELDETSCEAFLTTFHQIQKNFHHIFRRLFGGGQAKVELSDPSRPLDSDIQVFIQPPGKKIQNINLLSGGEKSLIAVSLMFAMFLIKPAPFCLFDEVDAALDKANIIRFSKLLDEFRDRTQFVVISHNERMVASIDYVYGITMSEGETKVISLKFQEEKT